MVSMRCAPRAPRDHFQSFGMRSPAGGHGECNAEADDESVVLSFTVRVAVRNSSKESEVSEACARLPARIFGAPDRGVAAQGAIRATGRRNRSAAVRRFCSGPVSVAWAQLAQRECSVAREITHSLRCIGRERPVATIRPGRTACRLHSAPTKV